MTRFVWIVQGVDHSGSSLISAHASKASADDFAASTVNFLIDDLLEEDRPEPPATSKNWRKTLERYQLARESYSDEVGEVGVVKLEVMGEV